MPYMHDTPPTSSPSRTPSPESGAREFSLIHSSSLVERSTDSAATLRRKRHHESDIVVVGAGILGSALAITLARPPHNRSVVLIEKSLKQPDRIVGELLQPGGVSALKDLGLEDCLEGIDAITVKGYQVIYYGESVGIPYPNYVEAPPCETNQRAEGRSFHHGRLIHRLRQVASKEPNISLIENTVTEMVRDTYTGQVLGVRCQMTSPNTSSNKPEADVRREDAWFGKLTVVADGYASKFRKEFIPRTVTSRSKFWGLELIDASLPQPYHGHVILGDGAPVLLYQIGTHETRALVDIPDGLESASIKNGGVKGHLRKVVLPNLPEIVRPSFERALNDGRLRSMPNSFLPPSINRTSGLIILGDAMNMRHPLTGGGMTVAFNDVVLLSQLLSPQRVPDLGNTKLVLHQMHQFHWQRKRLSSTINILAQALYSLFAANDPQLKALQLGCFRYFQRGGQCVDGPVGLLAGIIRQPLVLFYHFFSVALLAIWIHITSAPLYLLPWSLLTSGGIFYKACLVLFPIMISELRP